MLTGSQLVRRRAAVASLVLLTAFGFYSGHLPLVATVDAESQRLVSVYADGQSHVFATASGTVGDVLNRAGIVLGPHDLVEPAIDTDVAKNFFNINVYRARPVTIVDGYNTYHIVSAYQNPRLLAKEAGLTIYDEDGFSTEMISDVVADGGVGVKVTSHRSVPLTVRADGHNRVIRTLATTVGEALSGAGFSLGLKDAVNPGLSSRVIPGEEIIITRVTVVDANLTTNLPMPTRTVNDASLPGGQTKVQQAGSDGHITALYRLHYENGVVVKQDLLKTIENVQPVERIVVVGTKLAYNGPVDHAAWMKSAGINESDYGYIDYIISHESGWGVTKSNYQGSGAYGLGQALPASKMAPFGSDYLTNPVTQLKWANSYAAARYGSWEGAYIFWKSHRNW